MGCGLLPGLIRAGCRQPPALSPEDGRHLPSLSNCLVTFHLLPCVIGERESSCDLEAPVDPREEANYKRTGNTPDRDPERLVRDYADLARYVRRIYLLYYEGRPTREVARIVGSTNVVAHQHLSRTRASLRDDLKGDYDGCST